MSAAELEDKNIHQLRAVCKSVGVTHYFDMKKDAIIEAILAKQKEGSHIKAEPGSKQTAKQSSVQKGFLKKNKGSKGSVSSSSSAVDFGYFAFAGFSRMADGAEICSLVQHFCTSSLGGFNLEVVGFTVWEATASVGVKYLTSESEDLEKAIFEKRDLWQHRGDYLATVQAENPELFRLPASVAPTPTIAMPAVPGLPQFNVSSPARRVFDSAPSLSPEILAAKRRVADLRSQMGTDASETQAEPSNSDIMRAIKGIKETMVLKDDLHVTQLETVKGFRAELAPLKQYISEVDVKATQALTETKDLNDRLVKREQASVQETDRVGRLEGTIKDLRMKIENLELKANKGGIDDSYKQIVFLGLPKIALGERIKAMRAFMDEHFADIGFAKCSVKYKGSYKDGGRTETNVGYVEFASGDVRDTVLDQIQSKDLVCHIGGKKVDIKRARTQNASQRNRKLRDAADMLKTLVDNEGDVEIQWGFGSADRGVTVRGVYAYDQPSGKILGTFTGDYAHLELPP